MVRGARRRMGYLKKTLKRRQRGGNPTDYRELLTTYAVNDAIHDFEDYARYNTEGLLEGIPIGPFNVYKNENDVLESILINKINGDDTALPLNMETIYTLYNEYSPLSLELLFNNIARNYQIKVIPWQIDEDVIVTSKQLLKYFERPRTFIIDHFTLKFFYGLKNGTIINYDTKNPYYILYNRENENDAAKKGVFKLFTDKGIHVKVSHDTGEDKVIYPMWNEYNMNYNTMFYSNYNLELKYTSNRECNLQFTKNEYIHTIYNTKEYNSINVITMNDNPLDIKFQQKRSGDALQALSVFDNTRTLTDMSAHNNPKMLVTHDRLCLYYSLLMGIDVAFTTTQKEDEKYKVCVLFLNEDKIDASYNFRGGRTAPKRNTRKLRRTYIMDTPPKHIEEYYILMDTPVESLNYKQISNIFMIYIHHHTNNRHIDSNYSNILYKIKFYNKLRIDYWVFNYIIYRIIDYYNEIDLSFANFLRSIVCITTVLRVYEVDLGESMDTCYENHILKSATPEILEILEQYPPERRAREMWSLLRWDRGKRFPDVYDEVCYCSAWDIEDYARIMLYIMDNNLDIFTTLHELQGPYGIQTTAETILDFAKFPYERRTTNTPELRSLVDRIHKLPKNDNLRGWKYIKGRVEDYLMETFNRRFKWCEPFWE